MIFAHSHAICFGGGIVLKVTVVGFANRLYRGKREGRDRFGYFVSILSSFTMDMSTLSAYLSGVVVSDRDLRMAFAANPIHKS